MGKRASGQQSRSTTVNEEAWWTRMSAEWDPKVRKGQLGVDRLAQRARVPREHAIQFLDWMRRGVMPTLGDPHAPKTRQADSWRDCQVQAGPEPRAVPAKAAVVSNPYEADRPYYHNPATGSYVFSVPGVPRPVVLSDATVQSLARAYSDAGEGASINEISRTFGLPRAWVVSILRSLGTTHDSLPFTAEEITARSEDDLAEEALALRTGKLHRRFERERWRDVQQDALKWRSFEHHALEKLVDVSRQPYEVPKLKIAKSDRRFAAVVGISDFHWAKRSDDFENGEEDNRQLQRARLILSTQRVLSDVLRHGKPDKLIVPIGSDFLNCDNDRGGTTDGTPQDNDTNPAEMLATGCALMVEYVDLLRQVGAQVELVLCSGNHDRMLGVSMMLYLAAWYRSTPEVSVTLSAQPRQYAAFGSSMLMFAHGDLVSKVSDLSRLAAAEQPRQWGTAKHRMAFCGHIHTNQVDESNGFTKWTWPSLSGRDRWHTRQGYVGNRKQLAAILVDQADGVFAVVYAEGE